MPDNKRKTLLIQILLFVVTFITATLAGAEWMHGKQVFINDQYEIGIGDWLSWEKISEGLKFSIPFLCILTAHEFGHYLTARYYKVGVTLPFYIPFFTGLIPTIGTLGAFIRIKSILKSRKEVFDVGVAGPLAGFVIAFGLLWYGFTHLPPRETIYEIHPEYKQVPANYEDYVYDKPFLDEQARKEMKRLQLESDEVAENYQVMAVGNNLLFYLFERFAVEDKSLVPNKFELIHYPYLFAGYLALFFTALNLLPIGQLDGGHILYGLFGTRIHNKVSPVFFTMFVFYAGLGIFNSDMFGMEEASFTDFLLFGAFYLYFLYMVFSRIFEKQLNNFLLAVIMFSIHFSLALAFPKLQGFPGWLLFAFLIGKFLGVYHPPAMIDKPISTGRKIVGWIAFVVFILSFTPNVLHFVTIE